MLTPKRTFQSISLIATGALGALVMTAGPAHAGFGDNPKSAATPAAPTTDGQTVTVSVTGTMVKGGTAGTSGSTTVSVPAPCYYQQGSTGKEYAEWVNGSGPGSASYDYAHDPGAGEFEEREGYKKHANDTKGHWYGPVCDSGNYEAKYGEQDDLDAFFEYTEEFFENNDSVYVPDGQEPPIPPIPPEVLVSAAMDALEVPDPVFEHNPDGTNPGTVVNMPTWFWLTNRTFDGHVTATAGNNSATVNVSMNDFEVTSADGDSTGACPGGGKAWDSSQDANAASNCSIAFARGHESLGLTATTGWQLTWSYNDQEQGALDPVTATWTDQINVGEIQSVVTGVG